MNEVMIKGQAVRQYVDVIRTLGGSERYEAVEAVLRDEEFRALLREGRVLASGWYPVSWMSDLMEIVAREFSHIPDFPEKVGHTSAERNMRGIYAFLTRLISPERCIREVPRMWGVYTRGSVVEATILESGRARVVFERSAGMSRPLWRAMLMGGARRIFEQAGARDVGVRFLLGGIEAASRTEVEVSWRG